MGQAIYRPIFYIFMSQLKHLALLDRPRVLLFTAPVLGIGCSGYCLLRRDGNLEAPRTHTDYAGSDPLSHGDESQSGESPSRLRYPIGATLLSLEPTKFKRFHTGIEYVRKYYSAFSEGKYS